ncbi:hypothetical protein B5E84_02550 [Lachnoclostridium sp. An14]|nr:hypothetical protein B5E84_02550 [Lachnoclostridium sp. An14]
MGTGKRIKTSLERKTARDVRPSVPESYEIKRNGEPDFGVPRSVSGFQAVMQEGGLPTFKGSQRFPYGM